MYSTDRWTFTRVMKKILVFGVWGVLRRLKNRMKKVEHEMGAAATQKVQPKQRACTVVSITS